MLSIDDMLWVITCFIYSLLGHYHHILQTGGLSSLPKAIRFVHCMDIIWSRELPCPLLSSSSQQNSQTISGLYYFHMVRTHAICASPHNFLPQRELLNEAEGFKLSRYRIAPSNYSSVLARLSPSNYSSGFWAFQLQIPLSENDNQSGTLPLEVMSSTWTQWHGWKLYRTGSDITMLPDLLHVCTEVNPNVFNEIFSQESMACSMSAPFQYGGVQLSRPPLWEPLVYTVPS